jgi:drug/metabolite transporter (DMT)-like permease
LSPFARGALTMVTAALFLAAMSATVKAAAHELPNTMVVFFRNAVGLLTLLPWLAREGWAGVRTTHLREHLVRGLFGLGSMYCFFYAIAHLRLADAVLLTYTLPLFLPVVEAVWLDEPFPTRLWLPLGLGFVGILLVLRPTPGLFQPVALVGVVSAILAAVAQVGIRRLTATEPTARIVFLFAAIATAVSAVPALLTWQTPSPGLWWILLAAGVLATAGQIYLTRAYASAPAAWVGPFLYTTVVFSGLVDWLVWQVVPDAFFLAGAVLVVAAGVLTLRLRHTAPL